MMDCLNEMVGIIPEADTCPCITDGLPDLTKQKLFTSTSGKYLSDLADAVQMSSVKAAASDCMDFATLAIKARDNAVKRVKDDLIEKITAKFSKAKKEYIGNLGHPSFTAPYQPTYNLIGMRIKPTSTNRDSQIVLNSVQLVTFSPLTTTVKLYKAPAGSYTNYSATLVNQWSVTTASQIFSFVDDFTPLTLPLFEGSEPLQYFFVYDHGPAMPMNIQPTCNCPGVNEEVRQYVEVQGVELADLNSFPGVQNQYTGGIVINVIMKCRTEGLVCRGAYDPEDPVSLVLCNAITYKANEFLIEYIQGSPNINRLTMMKTEYLWGKRNKFAAAYDTRMEYIEEVINITGSDCFICKDVQDGVPTVIDILV